MGVGGGGEAGQKNQGEERKKEVLTRVYPHTALAPLSHKYPSAPSHPPFWRDVSARLLSLSPMISFLVPAHCPGPGSSGNAENRNASRRSLGVGIRRARDRASGTKSRSGFALAGLQFFSGVLLGARVG